MAGGSGVENCTVVGVVGGRGTSVGINFIYFINLCVLTRPDLSGLRWARLSVLASSHHWWCGVSGIYRRLEWGWLRIQPP
jgi:hypothetical protein